MIIIKSKAQIDAMRKAGRIAAGALKKAGEAVKPGVTTKELDKIVREFILSKSARPSFLGYGGFPASACISVNSEVIHGIPSGNTVIQEGDIVSIDVGALFQGVHGDCADTFFAGQVSDAAKKLVEVTKASFFEGMKYARPEYRVGDIGAAVEQYVTGFGYSAVRQYVGHGVGLELHESPEVPNFGNPGRGVRLAKGMTLAVEPMINEGTYEVSVLDNHWTVVTKDRKLSAHYENSILITDGEPEILTIVD